MARTTILMDDHLLLEVKRLAQTRGITLTEVIKSAVRTYVESQPQGGLPSFTAVASVKGEAGKGLAQNAKKLARRAVDPYEGSSREGRR